MHMPYFQDQDSVIVIIVTLLILRLNHILVSTHWKIYDLTLLWDIVNDYQIRKFQLFGCHDTFVSPYRLITVLTSSYILRYLFKPLPSTLHPKLATNLLANPKLCIQSCLLQYSLRTNPLHPAVNSENFPQSRHSPATSSPWTIFLNSCVSSVFVLHKQKLQCS